MRKYYNPEELIGMQIKVIYDDPEYNRECECEDMCGGLEHDIHGLEEFFEEWNSFPANTFVDDSKVPHQNLPLLNRESYVIIVKLEEEYPANAEEAMLLACPVEWEGLDLSLIDLIPIGWVKPDSQLELFNKELEEGKAT